MSPLRHLLFTVMCSVFLLDETDEARQNIALQKTAVQSSNLLHDGYVWSADLAVDNKTNFTGNNCRCCASTANESPGSPWWKIDLGEVVSVGKVKVFGMNVSVVGYGYVLLYGFKMFVSETTPYSTDVYINIVTSQEYLANQGVTDVLFGDSPMRYVALALHRSPDQNETIFRLIVCEVQVFMPCDDYHFEPDCAPCHCDEAPCNKSSGKCPGGCAPGWKGQRCDQVCNQGTFGVNCSGICKCYNATCDPTSGQCPPGGCLPGYYGDKCNMEKICESNTYSVDCVPCGHCLQGDACDKVSGYCHRGCETTHMGDHCAVSKARVHLESVFIGGGAGLVLMALIVGIVLGVRHALQKHRSATEKPTVASDCQDQPACEEQRHAPDHRNNAMYVELEHVSHDEHQYDTVIG